MNAILAFGRLLINHREKVLLGIMLIICGVLAFLVYGPKDEAAASEDGGVTLPEVKRTYFPDTTRAVERPVVRKLDNEQDWELYKDMRSPFRPAAGAAGPAQAGQREVWPEIAVRRVWKPSEESEWMAQLEVQAAAGQRGRSYIGSEGYAFANKYELTRIDRTRLCVEVLRQSDNDTKEFCQQ